MNKSLRRADKRHYGIIYKIDWYLLVNMYSISVYSFMPSKMVWSIITRIIIWVIYFVPSFVWRNHKRFSQVFVINLFLWWTIIWWIIALVIAVWPDDKKDDKKDDKINP